MDRIAIISDIHGNMPALLAVLEDIRKRDIGKIYCLGDLVGKGPSPESVVDKVREKCDVVLMGNWDDGVVAGKQTDMFVWARAKLGTDRVNYLGRLPFSHDFYMSGRHVRLLHASPQGLNYRVFRSSSKEDLDGMFDTTENIDSRICDSNPDVVGYGDIHLAYIWNSENRVLFNVGSVGNPHELPLASYVVLEGMYNKKETDSFSINFVRVPYDIELAVAHAKEAGMPEWEPYINELRTARYRFLK